MLNLFPIQFLAPLAFALLRVGAGLILIVLGIRHLKNSAHATIDMSAPRARRFVFILFGIFEILAGLSLTLGLYTQLGALFTMGLSLVQLIAHGSLGYAGHPPRIFFVLLLFASLSLLITGAGIFAFDLPI